MGLFWLNGDIRQPVLGIPNATPTERRMKSYPIVGLYSESLDQAFDFNIDTLPVFLSGVEGSVVLNVDNAEFAAFGQPADEAWDGEAVEATGVSIAKFSALTLVEIWARLADGSLKAELVDSDADIGRVGMQQQLVVDAVIANGQSLSAAVDLGTARAVALVMPATWTAAGISLEISADGVNYAPLYDDAGEEIAVPAAASRAIALNPARTFGVRHLKLRSGTSGAAVNQAAERTIKILAQP